MKLPVYLPDYFKSNVKISSPILGTLSNDNNINLIIDNVNLEEDIVRCYFTNSNKYVILEYDESINSFEIPLKDIQDDYLIIFLNKTPLIAYKILK